MTTLEHARHVIRRRGYAPHYTPTNVARFQPEMHEYMCEVLNVNFFFYTPEMRPFDTSPSDTG